MRDIATIRKPEHAAALLHHPIRRRIVAEAIEPVSAAELATRLGQPRQRLNYHVRQLARHGFLRLESRHRKRNMEALRYVATARAWVLGPQLLGELAATSESAADVFSASYLLGLAVQAQREISEVVESAADAGVRVLTLSLNSAIRFETAEQRAEFGRVLTAAVADIVARHTSPSTTPDGAPAPGRPFRLVLGCYPIPPGQEANHE
jgi:hypothetical protein